MALVLLTSNGSQRQYWAMSQNPNPIRKRRLTTAMTNAGWLDIPASATIDYSSEDPSHPIENLFDDRSGVAGSFWCAAEPDAEQSIIIGFDDPQSITRLL